MSHLTTLAAALESEAERLIEFARQIRQLAAMDNPENSSGEHCRLLTAAKVMEITGLPRGTVYRLGREGALGAVKVGERGVRFSESGVAEWIRDGGSSATQNSRSGSNG